MLRLSEASAHLGVSPATLRAYCERGLVRFREMPNGERRFEQEWLDNFKEQGMKRELHAGRSAPAAETTPSQDSGRKRWKDQVPPWERGALAAEASIKVERARQEIERLRQDEVDRRQQRDDARRRREAEDKEQARIMDLKRYGKSVAPLYPAELQRRAVRELDDWVSARTVPPYLSAFDQRNLVMSYVMDTGSAIRAELESKSEFSRSAAQTEAFVTPSLAAPKKAVASKGVQRLRQHRQREDEELERMQSRYENRRALSELVHLLKR